MSSLNVPRHWWGKIIVGFLGLLRGGIGGLLVGVVIGHVLDRVIAAVTGATHGRDMFFRALFSVFGHLAKADGRVTQHEIDAAELLMRRLDLNPDERQRAIAYFNAGKAPDFRLDETVTEFQRATVFRPDLRQMFVEVLVDAAMADGRLGDPERHVLARTAAGLQIPPHALQAMLAARGFGRPGAGRRAAAGGGLSLAQAYATLGVDEKASDAECKRAYRKLVGRYHPDKLVSQNLPEEMMEMAKNRVRDLNAAYDLIKQARGMK